MAQRIMFTAKSASLRAFVRGERTFRLFGITFLGLTPIAKAITKIKTGTNTAALNVVKNMFKALRNASMPSPFV